ncbi:PREDICTED: IQ domain-containing protein D [Chaetura pelagica]|uniref:IQ domain-containing protein D n=1 Tax=Chaetura pelagica TaxID=8897 RepID=UPI000523E903|nr:PREDICTED: IQ domain-containing protein D [Chaetura pelagica]
MKMFEPGQIKTDSLEMKRISTVLDKMIDKLELSGLIPRIIDSLDNFAGILGPEMIHNLSEHQKLSKEVEQLLASSGERDTTGAEQQPGCLCSLEQQLKRSLRNILRLLLVKPSLCQALKHQILVGESPAEVFIKAFGEFRSFMLEKLLMSPVEEEEKIGLEADISLRIKDNTEAITALQAELAAAIQTRDEEIHKKDNVIKELKTSVQDLPKDCKTSTQQIEQEGEKPQQEELEGSRARRARLQGEVQQLAAQLHALEQEHWSSELTLRKRKSRMETEIANWIQKYHTDLEEKQAEYDELQAAYVEEQAQLVQLTEKHAVLFQEYSQIEEERRLLQEKKDQALQEFKTMTRAATLIQAFWRGYFVRTLLKSKKKKKGKGKDKKGKK